jgi:hypothetical protein
MSAVSTEKSHPKQAAETTRPTSLNRTCEVSLYLVLSSLSLSLLPQPHNHNLRAVVRGRSDASLKALNQSVPRNAPDVPSSTWIVSFCPRLFGGGAIRTRLGSRNWSKSCSNSKMPLPILQLKPLLATRIQKDPILTVSLSRSIRTFSSRPLHSPIHCRQKHFFQLHSLTLPQKTRYQLVW